VCPASDGRWGKDGVDAMECRLSDAAKQGSAFVFDSCSNKIVSVDVDPRARAIGLAALQLRGKL
jgi:hypothetical protein